MDNTALIKRCQEGDRSAFEKLLDRHYETIYRFAYRWCGDQHNAQDITQQACMKLARSVHQFKHQSSFTTWLYRLVINTAKDFYKSPNQLCQHQSSDTVIQQNGNVLQQSDSDLNARRLYAQQILTHIDTLQDDLKEALILVFGTGMTHGQAAKQLNVKESTISWRIHEARKRLKQSFSTSDFDYDNCGVIRGSV